MVYILAAAASIAAVYFGVRYLLLRRGVKMAAKELKEITVDLEQNRIVRLTNPQKDLEILLVEINRNLAEIRKMKVIYGQKEKELLNQIEHISHDLRTPLTAILGFLSLVDQRALNEEDQESIGVARKKAFMLKNLIEQFYALSRLTADDYKLILKETDIGRILRETLIESYRELEHRNMEVQADIPDTAIFVYGDEDALKRIFMNLLQNVLRYGISFLDIHLVCEPEQVVVKMENDSEFMESAELSALFERFYTGDSSRNAEGTGLGLPIARYLSESMGGTLEAGIIEKDSKSWIQMELKMPILKI